MIFLSQEIEHAVAKLLYMMMIVVMILINVSVSGRGGTVRLNPM
jgi:hypothetical protein